MLFIYIDLDLVGVSHPLVQCSLLFVAAVVVVAVAVAVFDSAFFWLLSFVG